MVNYTQWRSLVDGSELPAIPDSEDFEFSNLTDKYVGDTGDFTLQSTTVDSGSNALECAGAGDFTAISRDTSQGLWERRGIRANYRHYPVSGNFDGGIAFATSPSGISSFDGYALWIDTTQNILRLRRYDNGTRTQIAENDAGASNISTGQFVDVQFDFLSDDNISATVDGVTVSTSSPDSTYDNVELAWICYEQTFADSVTFEAI